MIREIKSALRDFLKGAIIHDMHMLKVRRHMENLFMLVTMGDMLGAPVLPNYNCLRLSRAHMTGNVNIDKI